MFDYNSSAGKTWDICLNDSLYNETGRDDLRNFLRNLQASFAGLPSVANSFAIPYRPPLLKNELYLRMHSVAKRMIKLALATASHSAHGDFHSLARSLRWPEKHLDWIGASATEATQLATMVARPDMVFSSGKLRILEMNIHTALGGLVDTSVLPAAYLNSSWGRQVSVAHPVYADAPLVNLANLIKMISHRIDRSVRPSLAVLEWEYDVEMNYRLAATLMQFGIYAQYVDINQLVEGDGFIRTKNRSFQLALKSYSLESVRTAKQHSELSLIAAAAKKGRVLPDEVATLVSDKRILAMLSEHCSNWFPDETEFVNSYLPWTRTVAPGFTVFGAEKLAMEDLLTAKNKDAFVLKPGLGEGGEGVMIGRGSTRVAWENAVSNAITTGEWVVQEYQDVDSITLPFWNETVGLSWEACPAVVAPYVVGSDPAGALMRYTRDKDCLVMNFARGAGVCPVIITQEGN